MNALENNIPLNLSLSAFYDNAHRLNVTPEQYFNEFDFKLLELSNNPDTWNLTDWGIFMNAVEIDAEHLFYKRNNL